MDKKNLARKRFTAKAALDIASSTFGSMASILGEESKAGKAFATAQATIDTFKAANSAYASMAGIPIVGPALGAAAAVAAIVAGAANVKKDLGGSRRWRTNNYANTSFIKFCCSSKH